LSIKAEPDMHEYVMDAKACAELSGGEFGRIRRKVKRFLREAEDYRLEIKPLNLSSSDNRQLILDSVLAWQKRFPNSNDPGRTENQAIEASLRHHEVLGLQNLCVFIDAKLHGVVLFHTSLDGQYLIMNHLKVDYSLPFIFDYLTNQVAIKATEIGAPYLNMEMDLGIEGLRQHKLGLRPVNFFKKYAITPK
jgi:hypothetical protein